MVNAKSKGWWARPPWTFILKSIGLSLIFLGGHYLFELSSIGKDFKMFESEVLLKMLGISHNPDFLPIIVNISPTLSTNSPTNRALLDTLIKKLDTMKVRAIGIDVDFSPLDNGQPVTPTDWTYFSRWHDFDGKSRLKLLLGVYRRAADLPSDWLGREDFRELAAGIARPSDDSEHNFLYFRRRDKEKEKEKEKEKGLSSELLPMSVALYNEVQGQTLPDRLGLDDGKDGRLHTSRYRIDYSDSLLKLLAAQTIDYARPEDLDIAEAAPRKLVFRGRVVLIGDASGFEDQYCRPFAFTPTAGVVAHAASLVTLRQGGLREIEGWDTALLDLAEVVFGCLLLLIFYFWPGRLRGAQHVVRGTPVPTEMTTEEGKMNSPGQAEGPEAAIKTSTEPAKTIRKQLDRLETLYCILAALMIGLVGLSIVSWDRIFWPDFLWASASLFIHPFISETFFPFFGGLAGEVGRMFERAFSDPKGAPHAL